MAKLNFAQRSTMVTPALETVRRSKNKSSDGVFCIHTSIGKVCGAAGRGASDGADDEDEAICLAGVLAAGL